MEVQEEKNVKLVAYKLTGGASAWWEQTRLNRTRQGKTSVRSWLKMKCILQARFLPPDYDQTLFQQYQNYGQESRIMAAYTEEFQQLQARNELSETEAQQVSRFIGGLHVAIQDGVSLQAIFSIREAINSATRAEA